MTDRQTHICFVTFVSPLKSNNSGIGTLVRELSLNLKKKNFKLSLIIDNENDLEILKKQNIFDCVEISTTTDIHYYLSKIPILGEIFSPMIKELEKSWGAFKCLNKIHSTQPIDILEFSEDGNYFGIQRFKAGKKIVRLHGSEYRWNMNLSNSFSSKIGLKLREILSSKTSKNVSKYVYLSDSQKSAYPLDKLTPNNKIYNLINPIYKPFTEIRETDYPTLFYAGRIQDIKGILSLIEVFSQICKSNDKVRLIVAGSFHPSIPKDKFYEKIKLLKIKDRCELIGTISADTLRYYYAESWITIVPSINETFGYTGLESMCCGGAVISTKVGIYPEVIENYKNGILIDTPEDMLNAITALLNNNQMRHSIKQASKDVINHFDLKKILNQNLKLYTELN